VPPTSPLVGLSERKAFTVNVVVALFVPSDASTVSAPAGAGGTVKSQLKLPVESVLREPEVHDSDTPLSVNVEIVTELPKPVPVATTPGVPTMPLVGLVVRLASSVNWLDAATTNVPLGAVVHTST
jgi:hypothetical protein